MGIKDQWWVFLFISGTHMSFIMIVCAIIEKNESIMEWCDAAQREAELSLPVVFFIHDYLC